MTSPTHDRALGSVAAVEIVFPLVAHLAVDATLERAPLGDGMRQLDDRADHAA